MGFPSLSLKKKRHFALVGDNRFTMMSEVLKISTGTPSLRLLATTEGPVNDKISLNRLLASTTESFYGDISIALPLSFFEILTVSIPLMADEAIGKALPYQLAKAIDKPLSQFIYDWQISQRLKDKLQLTVYLFPLQAFEEIRQEFSRKQIEVAHLEADVFAAFAYLDRNNRLKTGASSLSILIWPDTISLAVCENNILTLVRDVSAQQPDFPFEPLPVQVPPETETEADQSREIEFPSELSMDSENIQIDDTSDMVEHFDESSILAGFDLFPQGADQPAGGPDIDADATSSKVDQTPTATVSQVDNSWADYLQHISLEIMRTRDYYASVIKGGPIKNIFVSGAEEFFEDLNRIVTNSLEIEIESMALPSITGDFPPAFNVISLGTGVRW